MKLTDKQQKFIAHIGQLGRLMDDEEAVDYYVENHMTVDVSCNFNTAGFYWAKQDGRKPKRKDYVSDFSWDHLKIKATDWHRRMIGQLVLRGYLQLAGIDQPTTPLGVSMRNSAGGYSI